MMDSLKKYHHTLKHDLIKALLLWAGCFFIILGVIFFLTLNNLVEYMIQETVANRLAYQTQEFAKHLDESDQHIIGEEANIIVETKAIKGMILIDTSGQFAHISLQEGASPTLHVSKDMDISSLRQHIAGLDHLYLYEAPIPRGFGTLALIVDDRPILHTIFASTMWTGLLLIIMIALSILALHHVLNTRLVDPVGRAVQLMKRKLSDKEQVDIFGKLPDEVAVLIKTYDQIYSSRLELEGRYRSVLECASYAIISSSMRGDITGWNKAAEDIFGYSEEEALGMPLTALMPERYREKHSKGMKRFNADSNPVIIGKRVDFYGLRKNGSEFPLELSLTHFENSNEVFYCATIRDLSESRKAEELVRKLSRAVEQTGESIVITNTDGVIEYVNPGFTKITGYSAEDVIGKTPALLRSGKHDPQVYQNLWQTINNGQVWNNTTINRRKDGEFYTVQQCITAIRNEENTITHFVDTQLDVTEQKGLEAQLLQSQKMEALGTLVGGIAHDFNNMLAGMTGNLYLAKKKLGENPDVLENLANVEALSFRAADMIQQLLTYARKDMVSIIEMSLVPFMKEAMKFLRTSIPENINVKRDINTDAMRIMGDDTQLHQVLMNLISNACDALQGVDEPCITIRLEPFHADDIWIKAHRYFKMGNYAHLSIADNGCGIPEDKMKFLFDPFFTTKEVGKGTGLGLSMVFGAIKTHRGFVDVESIEGKGSTFHIYIPLLEKEEADTGSDRAQAMVEGHGELILLVDDEMNVRETTAEVLEVMGYKLLRAADGLEAMEVFDAHQEEIALLILDVIMPRMGGKKVADRIREIKPDIPVIFMTGYDKGFVLNEDEQLQNSMVLTKPMQFDDLSQSIRTLLG
ncbi:MAG: PAS domain S-box protein [Mariprofundaceae bacterium]